MKSVEVTYRVTRNGDPVDVTKNLWIEVDQDETNTDLIKNEIEIALVEYYEAIANDGEEIVITTDDNIITVQGKKHGNKNVQLYLLEQYGEESS